jgi:orotate phosphoribosyltransferase
MSAIQELFVSSGALLSGHFKLSSGLHSDQYFQCALPLSDPPVAEKLGRALADAVKAEGWKPSVVVSPALGGVVIGHEAGRALGVRALFAERQDGAMTLRRGFSLKKGEKVLVVEDVITTGKSTGEVVALLKTLGASVVGAASIVLRAETPPDVGVPLKSLAKLPVKSWEPEKCPLCKAGKPVVKPGSRPC